MHNSSIDLSFITDQQQIVSDEADLVNFKKYICLSYDENGLLREMILAESFYPMQGIVKKIYRFNSDGFLSELAQFVDLYISFENITVTKLKKNKMQITMVVTDHSTHAFHEVEEKKYTLTYNPNTFTVIDKSLNKKNVTTQPL